MKPSIQKLKKIFKLEAERKYDNHAVVGGLERMLDYWEPEARARMGFPKTCSRPSSPGCAITPA